MGAGLVVYAENGVIQIDDAAPVLCLRYMGSSTVVNRHPASTNFSANLAYTVDITVTAETPQIYLKGEAEAAAFSVIATVKSGNTWTFRVIGMGHSPRFTYFIFDKPVHTANGAGVEVYDANGQVVFSSLFRPMDVKGFNFNDTQGNPNGINLSGSRQYAVSFNARITRTEWDDNQTNGDTTSYWTDYLNIASVNGGSISVNPLAIAGGSQNGGQGSPPIGSGLGGWGSPSTMTVVDVTGLVTAVTPASPVVSVSPSSQTATGSGSGNTVTGIVTATATGGSGGYSYQWSQTLTDARVVAVGATNTQTLQTQVVNQAGGTSIVTRWQCKVTDSAGNVGFSDEVTMTHIQAGAYTTPNPISIPTLSVISNDPLVNTSAGYFQINGINQPISLKFTRDSLTGNLYGRALMVGVADVGAGAGGPWTYYRVGALSTGLQIDDVQNGRWFSVFGELQTDSGVRTGAWQNYITNLTTGVQLASFRIEGTVDADNNYNIPDWTIDALNLTDLPINTVEYYGSTGHGRVITGINQPVVIRATVSNRSGNIDAGGCYLNKNGVTQGTGMLWTAGDDAREATFVNGDVMELYIDAQTFSGAKTGQFYTTLTNVTTGASLGGFWTVANVDIDNNYMVADYVPDTLSLPTVNQETNDPRLEWSMAWVDNPTITGINRPITLRFQCYNYSGNLSALYLDCYVMAPGAGWVLHGQILANVGPAPWLDVPNVVNGSKVSFNPTGETHSGRRSATWDMVCWSLEGNSAFAQSIGNRFVVDADNNYNTADYEPDGFSLPTLTVWTNENYADASSGQDARQLTGFNQPITLRLDLVGASGSVNGGVVRLIRYTPAIGWHEAGLIWLPQGGSCSATFLPGDYVYTDVLAVWTDSGRKDMNFTLRLTNETTGTMITQHAVNLTVDADNNYNLDYKPNNISFPSMLGSGTTRPLTIYGSPYTMTGFAGAVLMRVYFALNYHTVQAKAHPGGAEEVGDGATNGAAYCHVYRNGGLVASLQHGFWGDWSGPEQYDIVDAWFSPGDTIQFVLQFDVSNENETAQINGYCSGAVYFDNLTVSGNRVGSFAWAQSLNKPFG